MAAVRHVGFLKFQNFNCHTIRSVNVRYRAKFCADRSHRCGDMAVFDFLRWRPSAIFVIRLFGPSTKRILVVSVTVQNLV